MASCKHGCVRRALIVSFNADVSAPGDCPDPIIPGGDPFARIRRVYATPNRLPIAPAGLRVTHSINRRLNDIPRRPPRVVFGYSATWSALLKDANILNELVHCLGWSRQRDQPLPCLMPDLGDGELRMDITRRFLWTLNRMLG